MTAPTHPGELLRQYLIPLDLSQSEVARRLHLPFNRLNELVTGKRGMTPDTALRLADLFEPSAEFWLTAQATYDLHVARAKRRARKDARIRRFAYAPTPSAEAGA